MASANIKITIGDDTYEVELDLDWGATEPDVGIMGAYIDEWDITDITVNDQQVAKDSPDWVRVANYISDHESKVFADLEPPDPYQRDDYD